MSGAGDWIEVARSDDIAEGQGRLVTVAGERVALFRDGDAFFAIDDACPHHGASLADGTFHGGHVICPLHSWVFDVRTGHCPRDTHEPVRAWPIRCTDGVVEVREP